MTDLSDKSIGWVPEGPIEWAACRMRVFEVAEALTAHYGIKNHIGNMPSSVNAFVAQKICSKKVLDVANALKANGARTVFDLCDPHWLMKNDVLASRGWDVVRAINEFDHIIAPSNEMKRMLHRDFTGRLSVSVIPEGFDFDRPEMAARTRHTRDSHLYVGWVGISHAMADLPLVFDALRELNDKHGAILRLITYGKEDMPFKLPRGVPIEYVPWELSTCNDRIRECDVMIIPSRMTDYQMGKSVNRLALCWGLGVPVVASPLPSYDEYMAGFGAGASLITKQDWYAKLSVLVDPDWRNELGLHGRQYVKSTLDIKLLLPKWIESILGVT